MDELTVDQVFGIFMEELRKGEGLTTNKLRKHPALMALLVDDGTAEEAKAELEAIVLGRGDGYKARSLRNILVITSDHDGIEARSGPEERRRWATGDGEYDYLRDRCLIPKSPSSHVNYEKEELREVAELICDRALQRKRARAGGGAFQAVGDQQLTKAGHSAPFTLAEEVTDNPDAWVREDQLDQVAAEESVELADQPRPPAAIEPGTSLLARLGSWAEQRQQALAYSWEPRPLRDRLIGWKRDWSKVSREAKVFVLLFITLVLLAGVAAVATFTK